MPLPPQRWARANKAAAAAPEASSPAAAAASSSPAAAPAPGLAPPPGLESPPRLAEEDEDVLEPELQRAASKRKDFEPYLSEAAVEEGLRNGTLFKGPLRVSLARPGNAWVTLGPGSKVDAQVKGSQHRNRAVHGDIVVVKLLPSERTAKAPPPCKPTLQGTNGNPAVDEDDLDAEELQKHIDLVPPGGSDSEEEVLFGSAIAQASAAGARPSAKPSSHEEDGTRYARVVYISDGKGRNRTLICSLHPHHSVNRDGDDTVRKDDHYIKAQPTDKRMPWILIKINDIVRKILKIPGKLDKFRLWPVTVQTWRETAAMPLGRLQGQCLGQAGDMETEEKHALIEHELDNHDVDFSEAELDEVDKLVEEAHLTFEAEAARRTDLRAKRIFTIDPATARDLDDAIHVDDLDDIGQVEIGVHIADVGHFLKVGSITDTEAQRRTTSIYLINRVIPMLPHGLCNHLCSLNPNEPKLAFSAFFRVEKASGKLIEDPPPWFKKTAIKCCCRLNYEEVQDVLDGKEIERPPVYGGYCWGEIERDCLLLYEVCGNVRNGRMDGGAMTISKEKMVFHTRESSDGTPTGFHLESHCASHWVIEELMLLANRCVAKHICDSVLYESAVLRNHKSPDDKKADALQKFMTENLGLDWAMGSAKEVHRSCQAMYKRYGPMLGLCVEMMTMRAGMKQAEYFVVDTERDENPHHYALNFDHYTHFTSPIRRYPDVMVHRVLCALLCGELGEPGPNAFQQREQAVEQVAICNEKKSAARKCSEHIDRSVFCIYLRNRKEWFYTVGTVLGFQQDEKNQGRDSVTVYCSQLGRESKAKLCSVEDNMDALFTKGVDDTLMLPASYKFRGKGCVELVWQNPKDTTHAGQKLQHLKTLSCIPIVIIPTNTVPIDYALFFVSPFHSKADELSQEVPPHAAAGFEWHDTVDEEEADDGVHLKHDAFSRAEAAMAASEVSSLLSAKAHS